METCSCSSRCRQRPADDTNSHTCLECPSTFSQPSGRGDDAVTASVELKSGGVLTQSLPIHMNSEHPATNITSLHMPYLLPYHSARMAEPIVEKITTTPWTRVISDNQLLRRLIYSYFYHPHPCGPFVHKDLFLEDMAGGRIRFCSPLLVHAILSSASVRIICRG
jgi:hypothetical protein